MPLSNPSGWCPGVGRYNQNILALHPWQPPDPTQIYFGLELEQGIDTLSSDVFIAAVQSMRAALPESYKTIFVDDGSLTRDNGKTGVELVTHPYTVDEHLAAIGTQFFKLRSGHFLDDNTGLHVHVSRLPLTLFTIGKLSCFMNASVNKPLIELIGHRPINSRYAQMVYGKPKTAYRGTNKYEVLNLAPSSTIEFRFCRAPATQDIFEVQLRFIEALVNHCLPGNGAKTGHYRELLNFLASAGPKYKKLRAFLAANSYPCV